MIDITDFINNDIKPLRTNDSIAVAQDLFAEYPFSHFPVMEDDVYIGCANAEDTELMDIEKKVGEDRFSLGRFFVRDTTIWLDVLEAFAKNETNVMPILDSNNKYIGYYEIADIIRFFHETPFLKENGGILVVEKNIADYSMSEAAQIVESNNSKLLGLFVSDANLDKVQITIKISTGGLSEIIQTFRRYNYDIISEHQEDVYLNTLKDRSDYLDKYLNI
ncbi:CBS domain-containing protein [Flavobacterium salilacus subsp. salilacus]|uniref:CBS domain-containing protein n=1 Tax=Flavobacterium TaxID=237 RepID=UPI0010755DC3|nr:MULTISPECIES: CBS domain-containing protein [Flavobacterium]KAF2518207.1 CBS domain-containing protein [Flavobacterium salilacus subsp. salilacus]MBE1615480.1 CBS domain-containing protein [Flavobacterium sp. SaA2.13]NDI99271.1 CBS domain-containing protein [Flavobacterium salilacus subsp. altitudinum]